MCVCVFERERERVCVECVCVCVCVCVWNLSSWDNIYIHYCDDFVCLILCSPFEVACIWQLQLWPVCVCVCVCVCETGRAKSHTTRWCAWQRDTESTRRTA